MKFLIILFLVSFGASLSARKKGYVDVYLEKDMELQRQTAERSGFANAEVDNLHKEIEARLPYLKKRFQKTAKGEYRFMIPIASGESIRGIAERYIYNGVGFFYTDSTGKKLRKIVFEFTRINPFISSFKEEKRILMNPTPFYGKSFDSLDRNDDIRLMYLEKDSWKKKEFEERSSYALKDIRHFEKKARLLDTYIQYMRRLFKKIKREVYTIELAEKAEIEYMLQFR